jgi:DNA-binding NarL/FixJ family response regulator
VDVTATLPYGTAWQSMFRAGLALSQGDDDGACDELVRGWQRCLDAGPVIDRLVLGPDLAVAYAERGLPDGATEVAGHLEGLASRNPGAVTMEAAWRTSQAVATADPRMLVTAAQLWQRSPRRALAARGAELVSRGLVLLGKGALAGDFAAEAVRAYVEVGAAFDADRVRELHGLRTARDSGARQRRPPRGWESLTPTERLIAGFVETGESNSEIAARLVVSRRTVESHVSHILAKLSMRSRAELIVAAAQRGRLPEQAASAEREGRRPTLTQEQAPSPTAEDPHEAD